MLPFKFINENNCRNKLYVKGFEFAGVGPVEYHDEIIYRRLYYKRLTDGEICGANLINLNHELFFEPLFIPNEYI